MACRWCLLGSCSEEIDRIVGFEVGADDYVPKPCSPRELLARVRAVARRCGVRYDAMPALLRFGRLEIDEAAREARLDGRDAGLKPREFALLLTMARSPGVAFSRALLLERVWGYDFDGDERTVDVHVRRLRLRVEERPSRPGYVRTVHGYGYKFSADPERASPPARPVKDNPGFEIVAEGFEAMRHPGGYEQDVVRAERDVPVAADEPPPARDDDVELVLLVRFLHVGAARGVVLQRQRAAGREDGRQFARRKLAGARLGRGRPQEVAAATVCLVHDGQVRHADE